MKYAIIIAEDGRVMSVTSEQYAPKNAILVDTLPDGNRYDYRYIDGVYVYDPIHKEEPVEPTPTLEERVSAVEDQLAFTKIILGVE